MYFNVVCFSIYFIRLKIMATSHIWSTSVLFTDFLHRILLFSIHFLPIYSLTISAIIIISPSFQPTDWNSSKSSNFYHYQINALPCKYNPYMACILICDNSHDYLNEHTPLKQYLSEIQHINSSDNLDPCSFPWIYLVLEQQ